MLEKLRSRHSIDLPAEGFRRSNGLFVAIGGIALLFVLIPLLLALYAVARTATIGIAIGVAALLLVWIVWGAIGKPGYARK
jgi:hypothetical protein